MLRSRDFPLLAALVTAGYYLFMTGHGLAMRFAPDDMQNMYRYWNGGLFALVKANLFVVTDYYRPMGGLFYLPLLRIFRFDPFPYRLVIFVMLCVSAWLLYAVARRLTGSRFGGGVAVVTGGFHSNAAGVYLSTAVVYEVLCYVFTAGALVYYVRIREKGAALTWKQMGVLLALTACALNSKEMGVVVAAALVLYELLFRAWPLRRVRFAELWPVVLVCGVSIAYLIGKATGSAMLANLPDYRPVLTLDRYLETTRAYVGYLLLADGPVETWEAVAFWIAVLAAAALLRSRAMVFGALFAWVAFIPVNFVSVREGFVLHIPLLGVGVWAGSLVNTLVDLAAHRTRATRDTAVQVQAIVFAVLVIAAIAIQYPNYRHVQGFLVNAQRENWEVLSEFRRLDLNFRPGARVLFRDTPFEDNFDVYFMAKLWSRDPSLRVSVVTEFDKSIRGDLREPPFDREFQFEGTRIVERPTTP